MKALFFQAIVMSAALLACGAHSKNTTTTATSDTHASSPAPPPTHASATAASATETAPPPTPSSVPQAPSAHPPFSFVKGSARDFFASDNDLLARYIQRERNPGWGARADMTGGPADEWLVDVFQYAIIVTPDLGGFYLRDFGTGNVAAVEARALTGAAKKDAVVRYFTNEGDTTNGYRHEILEVWSIGNEGPIVRFSIELGVQAMCCSTEAEKSSARFPKDGGIEIVNEGATHTAAKFTPTTPEGVLARIPSDVKSRLYKWDGSAFKLEKELK